MDNGREADVGVDGLEVDIDELDAPPLPGEVYARVAGTGRCADDVGEVDVVVEESVDHTGGEDTSHAPTFKNETEVVCHMGKDTKGGGILGTRGVGGLA